MPLMLHAVYEESAYILGTYCLLISLTLHEHQHPHVEADACGACGRDVMLDCIVFVMVLDDSSPL